MSILNDLYQFTLPSKWQVVTQKYAQTIIESNGNLSKWLSIADSLPNHLTNNINFVTNKIQIGNNELDEPNQAKLELLLKLAPWRKGPFDIFGLNIDSEWRSDWKWNRLKNHINLIDKRILDIGCGNGYYLFKMLGAGAKFALGIDPNILFIIQFLILRRFIKDTIPAMILPFKLEDLPTNLELFDISFSMGVLYHRRSPLSHLAELKKTLIKGGTLILETLIVDGDIGFSLMPKDRYAKMRNIWFIPSIGTLKLWLQRTGFIDIHVLDITVTDTAEQRKTKWMTFESLEDFLDPLDKTKTIEGYPAPKRAIIKAIAS